MRRVSVSRLDLMSQRNSVACSFHGFPLDLFDPFGNIAKLPEEKKERGRRVEINKSVEPCPTSLKFSSAAVVLP